MKRGPWLNPFDEERVTAGIIFKRKTILAVREAFFSLNPFESVVKNFETRSFHPLIFRFTELPFELHA